MCADGQRLVGELLDGEIGDRLADELAHADSGCEIDAGTDIDQTRLLTRDASRGVVGGDIAAYDMSTT